LTVVYVLNRTPSKSVEGATPFDLWYGKKPSVHHLRTFGCIGYVNNTNPGLSKLDDRDRRMVFAGYEVGTKGYRMFDPVTNKVHVSRDVVFEKSAQSDWSGDNTEDTTDSGNFVVEYMVVSSRCLPEVPEQDEVGEMQPHSPAGVPVPPPRLAEQGGVGPEPDMH
jgi:hypothetical protein